jgi:ankyrin repeat protein
MKTTMPKVEIWGAADRTQSPERKSERGHSCPQQRPNTARRLTRKTARDRRLGRIRVSPLSHRVFSSLRPSRLCVESWRTNPPGLPFVSSRQLRFLLGFDGAPYQTQRLQERRVSDSVANLQTRLGRLAVASLFAAVVLLTAFPAPAATNDATAALQKGLFEEEANHNLGAAIQAYQSVVVQFDKDRKLAATAVFRLGECYRKQGNTNEANAQYQRVLREFADQPTFATLSRQNLAALGGAQPPPTVPAESTAAAAEAEAASWQAQLDRLERLSPEERGIVIQQDFPDPALNSLRVKLAEAKQRLVSLQQVYAPQHPEVKRSAAEVAQIEEQIKRQVDTNVNTTLIWLTNKLEVARAKAAILARGAGGLAMSDAARQEQKRLLQEEVTLVEKKLQEQQNQVQVGRLTESDLWPTQRDILQLKRRIAALDSDAAALAEQKRLAQEETRLVEKQIDIIQKRAAAGRPDPDQLWAAERDLLELKRQIAALDAGVPVSLSPAGAAASPATSAEAEEVKRIRAMIKDSPDLINAKASDTGLTPLGKAAEQGQLVVAQFLLANGADVESKNPKDRERTPLHYATDAGHRAMVELLLNKGAKIGAADTGGVTALHLACERGFKNLVEMLLDRGADINARNRNNATPLHFAAANGFRSIAEVLLAHGADANTSGELSLNARNFYGTPLNIAVQRDDDAIFQLLLTNKADVNALNHATGATPLDQAAEQGKLRFAGLLLAHGAEVNKKNPLEERRGWTPLVYAVNASRPDMVALLLTNKADPNVRFDTGNAREFTSLGMAVSARHADLVQLLLDSKADPNLASHNGELPIFIALSLAPEERQRILALLLDHGADVNAVRKDSPTPLMLAAAAGDAPIVKLILDHKANVSAKDQYGRTALYFAIRAAGNPPGPRMPLPGLPVPVPGAPVPMPSVPATSPGPQDISAVVELLLTSGADPNSFDQEGRTPLDYANTTPGGAPLAKLLRQHGALDDPPRLDRIEVRRSSANYSATAFMRGTNDWNRLSLLEIIAQQLNFLSGNPAGRWNVRQATPSGLWQNQALRFPELKAVSIRRLTSSGRERTNLVVDVSAILNSGSCSGDPWLQWGDVVEVPEADHLVNEQWLGPDDWMRTNLIHCVSRKISIRVKGTTNELTLEPQCFSTIPEILPQVPWSLTTADFMLLPVLQSTKLIRASSDLTRVKVTRLEPVTGQRREWVLDCSDAKNAPDLWLRDGDVIELPDKP